jgi:cellulose synthase/poly-beta-1,6-N-acetylglucosamine synthase-like glycosyltransferase
VLIVAAVSAGLLLLTWIGYPLVIRLLATMRSAPAPADPADWPRVTAIVATREDPALVRARVEDLLAADYPSGRLDVVVGIDSSAERPLDAYGALDRRVMVVRGDEPGGKVTALNAAVRAATGDILVFTDTHQRFDRSAIRALVRVLTGATWGAVSGQLELPEGEQRSLVEHYWRLERRLRRDEARIHSAIGVSGSIYAMRRAFWTPLPAGLILDDLYVPMRLALGGHRVGFTALARAFDSRRTEPVSEFRRKVRTLTGNFQLCAWLPAVLVPGRNPVWLQFVVHKLLRLLTPWLTVIFVVSLLWALVAAGQWTWLAWLVGAGVLALLVVMLVLGARRLLQLSRWVVTMQLALVVATLNGLTGRWNVWQRSR